VIKNCRRFAVCSITFVLLTVLHWATLRVLAMASGIVEVARKDPRLISTLNAEALATLSSEGHADKEVLIARLLLRSNVWAVRRKATFLSSYSAEKTEEVLGSFKLPPDLAERCGLSRDAEQTWLDAVKEIQRQNRESSPLQLWSAIEKHPIVEYVHVQCQACGRQVPDSFPDPEDANLKEETPNDDETPFVRSGWFRGPRGPVVFVYTCPSCGVVSRWYRSLHPEITLNPVRWGRLCGEQEDLKVWLAKYVGVHLRVCCPMDWDHVWTEVWDGEGWQPLDPNCVNFARRLREGIGSWTRVLAIGTPVSGNSPADASEDATEAYILRANGSDTDVAEWRLQIEKARNDSTGASTQSRTLCGYIIEQAGFDISKVTAELRLAQTDFDCGNDWWELGSI